MWEATKRDFITAPFIKTKKKEKKKTPVFIKEEDKQEERYEE